MASKKTTSSARSREVPQPVTTARRPDAGKKNNNNTSQPQRKFVLRLDQYRLLGAIVMLFFGFVGVVSWFNRDGTLMKAYHTFISAQFGWGYYPMPLCMLLSAWLMFTDKDRPCAGRVICTLAAALLFGSFVQLVGCRLETLYSFPRLTESGLGYAFSQLAAYGQDSVYCCGGIFSGLLAALLYTCLRRVFGCILLTVVLIPLCVYALGGDVRALAAFVISLPPKVKPAALRIIASFRERLRFDDLYDDDPLFDDEIEPIPEYEDDEVLTDEEAQLAALLKKRAGNSGISAPKKNTRKAGEAETQAVQAEAAPQAEVQPSSPSEEDLFQAISGSRKGKSTGSTGRSAADFDPSSIDLPLDDVPAPQQEKVAEEPPASKPKRPARTGKTAAVKQEPEEETVRQSAPAPAPEPEVPTDQYIFPPLELLQRGSGDVGTGEETDENRSMLEEAIRSFGVDAQVVGVVRGPSVTRYEMKLAQGVKLSRITNLSGDIALSLGVSGVRIAPIADKISTVGVEVPNRTTTTVWLGDTIDTDTFRKSKSKLSIALGKDISGNVIVGNIAKMPHVLIAGTTGSGKSVCINSLILSLLYKSTPDEVKLIMVDPKMVELGIYNGLPHMLTPVVTDPKKAAGSLQWAVVEMLKRYRLFSEVGVRDLAGYNAVLQSNDQKIVPQVVIIIDELADLMMTAKKEVEESICRIAQMGRAAGMHLVVATQRPSSDVITGLMKANIPSRIAFAVSSGIESRIILDQQGAEKLIGMGDMLYAPIGVGKPVRIQGAFVTDEEREEVINFIKEHCEAEYDDEATRAIEKNAAALENDGKKKGSDDFEAGTDSAGEEYDELLPQAVDVIFEVKQASTSMLQRRLKLGYSRAGRLIDQLEQLGVVGPYQGSKPREILMTKQQWQERQYIYGTAPADSIAAELTDIADSRADDDAYADDEAEFLEDED